MKLERNRGVRVVLSSGAMLLAAIPANAHPGHGAGGGSWSLIHYLSEPNHVLGVVAVALCATGAGLLLRRWRVPRRRTS